MNKETTINRGKVLFVVGLAMLILSGVLWYANGGYMKWKSAKAAGCTNSGCYSEDWDATEILGDVNGYQWGGNTYLVTTKKTGCTLWPGSGATTSFFAVPGSRAASCTDQSGVIEGSNNTPVVTHWVVTGQIVP